MIVAKLVAVPVVIWLASYAGRRWGHRISGLISGFPLIAAPIVLFLSVEAPRPFVEAVAWATMSVAPAIGMHCLVYSWLTRLRLPQHAPRHLHWMLCLASAWTSCIGVQWLLTEYALNGWTGLTLALAAMLLLQVLMPKARSAAGPPPRIPAFEIAVRMAAAVLIAAIVMLGAQAFGPRVSGMLLGFPITASVLPVFTLYLYGSDATIRLLSGFNTGLLGFVVYFFVFASSVTPLGAWPAFMAGALASVTLVSLALGWQSWRKSTMR